MTPANLVALPAATDRPIPDFPRACARGISFRRIREMDQAFLSALYGSTRAEEVSVLPWSDAEKSDFLDMQFRAQHNHYMTHYPDADWLVIERDDEPIGRLYIEVWPSEIRVIDIALMPYARGTGLGRAVMKDVMALAAADGLGVGIHVEHNNPAMRLYRRLGFTKREDKGVYHLMRWDPTPAVGDAPT